MCFRSIDNSNTEVKVMIKVFKRKDRLYRKKGIGREFGCLFDERSLG